MIRLFIGQLFLGTLSAQQSPEIFYPFSVTNDSRVPVIDDGSSPALTLSQPFPFFDQNHVNLTVNTNGVISFLSEVHEHNPESFPLDENRMIIAALWADVDTGVNHGRVYYRQSTETDVLARATADVRRSFIRAVNFQATWVFIATWYHVTFYGGNSTSPVNDFQTVLITDGHASYAMFNYGNVTWTTRSYDFDGIQNINTYAQAGFNAGDGQRYFNVPGSRTSAIADVDTTTNVGVTGRWMFQVDEFNVVGGGCGSLYSSLGMQPRFSTIFGGTLVNVSGPCLDGHTDFVCRIGNKQFSGVVIDSMRATIVVPESRELGLQQMDCSVDGGRNFTHSGFFRYIADNEFLKANVTPAETDCSRPPDMDNLVQPGIIEWNPNNLPPNTSRVDIGFYEYRENGQEGMPIILLANLENNGRAELPTNNRQIKEDAVGTIRVTMSGERNIFTALNPFISSAFLWIPSTLGAVTYEDENFTKRNIVSGQACKDWATKEAANYLPNIAVTPSPCNLTQAERDFRFTRSRCRNDSPPSKCGFHNEASHCFQSTPGADGLVQHACYDKNGNILDFEHGGCSYDSSDSDEAPLAHFWDNVRPLLYCCKYGYLDLCSMFKKWRPTDNCARYRMIQSSAQTSGDPHLTTLDGLRYTFNGLGEFILVQSANFSIQGRAQQLSGSSRATVWTSIAIGCPGAKAEVRVNGRHGLEVLVNGKIETFYDLSVQTFGEIHVTSVVPDRHVMLNMRSSGIKVDIREVEKTLSSTFSLSNQWKNRTSGLLGNMNGIFIDDLQPRTGTSLPANTDGNRIYSSFGLTWRLEEAESLFTYPTGISYQSLNTEKEYLPQFGLPSVDAATADEGKLICGENWECLFDFYITNNSAIAMETKESAQRLDQTIQAMQNLILCPVLSSTTVGVDSPSRTVGSVVRLSCNEHFHLVESGGPKICQPNGTWIGKDIVCQKKCPFLSSMTVSVSSLDRFPGTIVYVSCAKGFKTSQPDGPRECLTGGNWNLPNIECSPISAGSSSNIQPSFFLGIFAAHFLTRLK